MKKTHFEGMIVAGSVIYLMILDKFFPNLSILPKSILFGLLVGMTVYIVSKLIEKRIGPKQTHVPAIYVKGILAIYIPILIIVIVI